MTLRPPAILILTLVIYCTKGLSQPFLFSSNKRTDTSIWKIKNKSEGIVPGNSTYFAVATNFSRNREYEICIGRTNGILTDFGRGMGYLSLTSWGFSYAYLKEASTATHTGKVFLEYSHIPTLLLGNFVVRADYSYNFTNRQQYLRPSAGLSLLYMDFLYNYSFKLNKSSLDNIYRHGITIRAKLIFKKRKWEQNYFVKNRHMG